MGKEYEKFNHNDKRVDQFSSTKLNPNSQIMSIKIISYPLFQMQIYIKDYIKDFYSNIVEI